MRASTIAKLAWYRPRGNTAAGLYSCQETNNISNGQLADIIHYAECYKDLQFGWHIASDIANAGTVFPSFLRGDDLFVWRAYNYIKGGEDPAVAGAVALTGAANIQTANTIRALLVTKNSNCKYVASKLALPVDVVTAYEKLFFNILDRKTDHAFIASIIYPNGRMVEAMENYLEQTGIGELMLRAGHLHGTSHVLYAAGIGDNPFSREDALTGADTLDRIFMADGCMYAGLGWLHQKRNAMPITNARLSIQAGKMGRGEQQSSSGTFGLGDTLRDELTIIGRNKAAALSKTDAIPVIAEIPANITAQ